jgi:eukaryotic-like serine/threonine-protein kinase
MMQDAPIPARDREAAELYLRASDMPPEVAQNFLARACAGRESLRSQVQALMPQGLPALSTGGGNGDNPAAGATIASALHSFCGAIAAGDRPELARYVPSPDDSTRERLLTELIKLDQKWRWSLRRPKPLEVYLREWPELRARQALMIELLRSECVSRAVFAAPASEAELELRFPGLATRVRLDEVESLARPVLRAFDTREVSPALPERFTVVRQIGEGGMGVVYEALDRQRGTRIALKTLPKMGPVPLYRFKHEFRTLAGLSHPNLVPLYELISDGSVWFFTMELIHGVDFITHVHVPRPEAEPRIADAVTASVERPASDVVTVEASRPARVADIGKLRAALGQLAEGVAALHAESILHRDLKPSNVLVREDGRVVILDFGLAKLMQAEEPVTDTERAFVPNELAATLTGWTRDHDIVGSVLYMSPEQAVAERLTAASDWYSVGVMLYEALTGILPFTGGSLDVMLKKQSDDLVPPKQRVSNVPDDLNDLCCALLHREPGARPTGAEVLARLSPASRATPARAPAARATAFVGRENHLATMAAAYRELERNRTVTVHVRGRSGAGKTALAQHFLGTLPEPAIVLSGRCYEQESVPYKALDSIIDELCRRLMQLPANEAEPLIPADIAALARIFPVLERVEAVSQACMGRPEIPDARELRRRAFAALGDMLHRLGGRAPLVLVIDDLQWGDVDSAALLVSLLAAAAPPRLLLIACYRTESAESNPCLVALNAARRRQLCFDVDVEPLPFSESLELAALLLGETRHSAATAARIARESGGNPYFVYELARQVDLGPAPGGDTPSTLDLDEALWRRVLGLAPAARHLLEVVAVAGKPLPLRSACEAASLGLQDLSAAATLRAERFVRSTGPGADDEIETYHDRIRESIANHLTDSAQVEHHRRLALALEAASNTDIEATAAHFHRAGLLDQAAHHYATAADTAAAALAFDRSAELYGLALRLGGATGDEARRLRRRRGDALANAGRGFDAGQEYQRAADGAAEQQAIELQRKAGYQYCVSGHIDEGREAFATVLSRYGKRLPRTRRQALLSLLWRRLLLRFRGMRFHERSEADVPREQLDRVDIFWSVAAGMTIADPIRGAEFQTYDLILALRAGEPYRIARALAWEAAHISMVGVRLKPRAESQLAAADALAARIDRPHATGMIRMSRGVAAYFHGDFDRCRRCCEEAAGIFRDQCTGVSWELETCNAFAFWSYYFRGEYAELTRRFSTLITEVRQRGARLAEADLTTFGGPFVWLAADDPEGAHRAVLSVMGAWSRQDFQVQHFTTLTAEAQIDLYRGDGRAAWDRVAAQWGGVADAMLLHVEIVRIYMLHLRARSALAALGSGGLDREMLLRSAARDARRLERERPPYARALARTIRAALAVQRGDEATAISILGATADELDSLSWGCFGAGIRRRYGELLGGDAGRRVVRSVDDALTAQGVRRPDLLGALQAPGFVR